MTPQKNTFNGILNVYKEQGYTSHDVVAKLRGILKQKKIGHTGTLDPAAEGVLPVCLGKATKVCELLTDKDKTYQAVLHLGVVTDTQDMTGEILEQKDAAVSETEVREAILGFVGEYAQVPPMYSALKVNGKKLCDLAREGKTVERKARKIKILEITIDQTVRYESLREGMMYLKKFGVSLLFDQFGVSVCNLKQALNLPFDAVKINHYIVCTYCDGRSKQLKYMINMLLANGWRIYLDGVNSETQLSILCDLDISYIQGNLVSAVLQNDKSDILFAQLGGRE